MAAMKHSAMSDGGMPGRSSGVRTRDLVATTRQVGEGRRIGPPPPPIARRTSSSPRPQARARPKRVSRSWPRADLRARAPGQHAPCDRRAPAASRGRACRGGSSHGRACSIGLWLSLPSPSRATGDRVGRDLAAPHSLSSSGSGSPAPSDSPGDSPGDSSGDFAAAYAEAGVPALSASTMRAMAR